ncbi:MAG: COX15/CtaA family protein [Deltaproteobacteria bacterium]|jgi:cytochrome c oxidase assembly protein subunit 15|nr:COX15/CtaA family protein [Deltaproteobacteria bacterium]
MSLARYRTFLMILAIMIVGLMALGAGVRTMNAGLSCPDWPLCFGKVIPDFHPAVWFEFVHRAYAGIVALIFAGLLVFAFRTQEVPKTVKTAAKWGSAFLAAQIIMGGLTVLLLVKAIVVTTHLLLATLFFGCVLWMYFGVDHHLSKQSGKTLKAPGISTSWILALPILVFAQIAIGGLVASTYSGSVCVDWPLCNGQWVPTWKGAIGLQIIHRFFAYALVALFVGLGIWALVQRERLSELVWKLFVKAGIVVILQTIVGIMNLLYFIPPHITVPHQTLAMILLGITLRLWFEAHFDKKPLVRGAL